MKTGSAVVFGSGPAAWSLAAALTHQAIDVTLVAPNPHATWPQTYGMWAYQWSDRWNAICGVADPFTVAWESVAVIGDRHHDVRRAYGILDNDRVRLAFTASAVATGRLEVIDDAATRIELKGGDCVVQLAEGGTIQSRLVFDGTGSHSTFVERESEGSSEVLQTAFGIKVRTRSSLPSGDSCVLMDWRGPQRRDASFLYALPYGDGRWLFEETSLARSGGLPQGELEVRLRLRLADLGVVIDEEEHTETVSFPMNVPLPGAGQRVVPIGAAAALVHPATGYSIAAAFQSALSLADVLGDVPGNSAASTAGDDVERCWDVLWSSNRRRARRLERYGLERLLTMDQTTTRLFFDTFFTLDPALTAAYLGGQAGVGELTSVMWNMFRASPPRLQRRLASGNPLTLARSLVG
jgi:lycopene beta-cyclase